MKYFRSSIGKNFLKIFGNNDPQLIDPEIKFLMKRWDDD